MDRLSPHFRFHEVQRSQTATRHGIDNNLPLALVGAARAVAMNILEPVRCEYGIPFSPSSWYRCPELNERIGGSSKSQHCLAQAVDFEVPGIDNVKLARHIIQFLDFDQLILEFYDGVNPNSGWIHCSYVGYSENRRSVLQFDGKNYSAWE